MTRHETRVDDNQAEAGMPVVRGAVAPSIDGQSIRGLPKELGILLLVGGVWGLLLPGPVGTPFLLLGGVILWPSAFHKVESCFEKRLPRVHAVGRAQINRFVADLEKRYPWPK